MRHDNFDLSLGGPSSYASFLSSPIPSPLHPFLLPSCLHVCVRACGTVFSFSFFKPPSIPYIKSTCFDRSRSILIDANVRALLAASFYNFFFLYFLFPYYFVHPTSRLLFVNTLIKILRRWDTPRTTLHTYLSIFYHALLRTRCVEFKSKQ